MSFHDLPDGERDDDGPQANHAACSDDVPKERAPDSKDASRDHGPALAAAFSEILRRVHEAESVEAVHQESVSGRQELETRFRDSLDAAQTDEIATMIAEHGEIRLRCIREKARPKQALDKGERILSREQARPLGLSDREVEVLTWIARGKRDADIGSLLGISVRTVGKHVENLLRKIHVESRTAAVAFARRLRPLTALLFLPLCEYLVIKYEPNGLGVNDPTIREASFAAFECKWARLPPTTQGKPGYSFSDRTQNTDFSVLCPRDSLASLIRCRAKPNQSSTPGETVLPTSHNAGMTFEPQLTASHYECSAAVGSIF